MSDLAWPDLLSQLITEAGLPCCASTSLASTLGVRVRALLGAWSPQEEVVSRKAATIGIFDPSIDDDVNRLRQLVTESGLPSVLGVRVRALLGVSRIDAEVRRSNLRTRRTRMAASGALVHALTLLLKERSDHEVVITLAGVVAYMDVLKMQERAEVNSWRASPVRGSGDPRRATADVLLNHVGRLRGSARDFVTDVVKERWLHHAEHPSVEQIEDEIDPEIALSLRRALHEDASSGDEAVLLRLAQECLEDEDCIWLNIDEVALAFDVVRTTVVKWSQGEIKAVNRLDFDGEENTVSLAALDAWATTNRKGLKKRRLKIKRVPSLQKLADDRRKRAAEAAKRAPDEDVQTSVRSGRRRFDDVQAERRRGSD